MREESKLQMVKKEEDMMKREIKKRIKIEIN